MGGGGGGSQRLLSLIQTTVIIVLLLGLWLLLGCDNRYLLQCTNQLASYTLKIRKYFCENMLVSQNGIAEDYKNLIPLCIMLVSEMAEWKPIRDLACVWGKTWPHLKKSIDLN